MMIFRKKASNTSKNPERLIQSAANAAIGISISLVIVKFIGWFETDSVSILASLLDSLFDATSSIILAFAMRYALQPADHDHRYGHGKAEPVAALMQAIFIAGSAIFLLIESCRRILTPVTISEEQTGMAIMAFSTLATMGLVVYQKFVIRRTQSLGIQASSENFRMDVLVNLSSFVALFGVYYFKVSSLDALAGAGIALYLLNTSFKIAKGCMDILMDRELPAEERERIHELALQHPQIHRVTDVRTRSSGKDLFIDLTLNMAGILTLTQANDIAEIIIYKIKQAYPNSEVHVHTVPWKGLDPIEKLPQVRPVRKKELDS